MSLKWYDDDEFNALSEELVPDKGKCESVAGEMLRAAGRISYRFYNDGELAVPPDLDDLIDTAAEDYVDEEFDEIVGGRRLNSHEESDAYQEAWHNARARAEELVEEDERYWNTDQLRAWSTAHYLMTKGNGEVRNLVSGIVSYGPTMSDAEYSDYVHALCDAVKEDVKQNPALRSIPTEDMFDHMGEGPTGEHMTGEFDDRAILDHRISNGYYNPAPDPALHQKAVEKYFEDDGEWLRQMNGFTEDAYQNFSDVMDLVGLDYDYDFDYFSPCSGITIKDPYWGYASHLRPIEDDELYGEYQYDLQKIWNEELEKIEDRLTDDDDEECAPEFFRAVGDRWFDFVRSECDWYMTDEAAKEWLSSNDISDDESLRAFIGDQGSDSGRPGIFSRAVGAVTGGIRSISETVNEATAKPANPFGGDASVSSGNGHEGKPMVDGYDRIDPRTGKKVHVSGYKNPRYKGPRR